MQSEFHAEGKRIFAGAAQQDGEIVFTIGDEGGRDSGWREEKIFEKFYRGVDSRTGGLGLGLSIARQLVQAHGGTIKARNRPEGGAQFTIRLPLGKPMRFRRGLAS